MAYLINASNSGLEVTSAPVAAAPFTFACWFYAASATSFARLMALSSTAHPNTHYAALLNRGDVAGDPLEWQVNAGGVAGFARTSTGYSASTWHHGIGVETSSASRAVYINGGNGGTDTVSHAPSLNYFGLGLTKASTGYFYSNHNITVAETAIWNVALGADERAALAAGFSPMLIRPTNLISYWPLGGLYGNHFRDIVGGYDLSQVGTVTAAEHPRIIYPGGALVIPKVGGSLVPLLEGGMLRGGFQQMSMGL